VNGMANQQYLDMLKQSVELWNQWRDPWRKELADMQPDLSKANLSEANLSRANLVRADLSETDLSTANLSGANLSKSNLSKANLNFANLRGANLRGANLNYTKLFRADLSETNLTDTDFNGAFLSEANLSRANLVRATLFRANLFGADLTGADLTGADLTGQDLMEANLSGANLSEANLSGLDLSEKDLSEADLTQANLTRAILVKTNLEHANLTGCTIYGISVWNVQLKDAIQSNLIVTEKDEPMITVDNLKVAQFIYLLLNNKEIRDVIDTITAKVVLILGRFTNKRKKILDALRDELRKHDYLPILFDFEKPTNRDITETVSTLAHMARFVVADITQAKSIPQELERIVQGLPSVPVQPLLQARAKEYGMAEHYWRYPWVLSVYRYRDVDHLLQSIENCIIEPAEQKAKELAPKAIGE
jgi:uncharacterized protein YjbI with pentapeptide repeats